MLTRNASFFSGITLMTVDFVGQHKKLRRLRLSVRVPGRTGPNGLITRHCGLHCGIRRKSLTSAQTVDAGALISIWACKSGATMTKPPTSCAVLSVRFERHARPGGQQPAATRKSRYPGPPPRVRPHTAVVR